MPINRKLDIICLYEESGLSAEEWARQGYSVYCYDIKNPLDERVEACGLGKKHFIYWDATDSDALESIVRRHKGRAGIVLSYPPCTDLAVSGAAWFASKLEADPLYRVKAMRMVYLGAYIGITLNVPYCIENPISVVSSEWRKPDYIFHPYEFGGYLPENDVHPFYPEYILPRDAYPKKTCYWTGGGFIFPKKKPVTVQRGYSIQHRKLGGKSEKTKKIRAASPRGVGIAIFHANSNFNSNVKRY